MNKTEKVAFREAVIVVLMGAVNRKSCI